MSSDAPDAMVRISMADIEDDPLIEEYWRRFPWDWAEEIQTILDTDPIATKASIEMLDKLAAWIEQAKAAAADTGA